MDNAMDEDDGGDEKDSLVTDDEVEVAPNELEPWSNDYGDEVKGDVFKGGHGDEAKSDQGLGQERRPG